MRDEQTSENQRSMLDYLISVLDNANDFRWDAAKASHGEVKDYTQTITIDQIRKANAQRHLLYVNNPQQYSRQCQDYKKYALPDF